MTDSRASLILIYGHSPHLQRVERRLRAAPELRVIQIDPDERSATQQLAALGEGVLLYDAATADQALIQAIHTLHPRLPTVGLGDNDGQELTLLGRMVAPAVMESLGQVLGMLRERET